MNKILLIGKSREDYLAGPHYNYLRLSMLYPESFDYIDSANNKTIDIQKLLLEYKKVVLCYQPHTNYPFKLKNSLLMKEKNLMVITRRFQVANLINSITNGFSIYKGLKVHKYFFPTVTTKYNEFQVSEPNEICYGFYYRPVTIDSFNYFCDKVKDLKRPVNIMFCGRVPDKNMLNMLLPNIKWSHTMDMKKFFSTVTHYVMPMSAKFIDPLPHIIMEAVQHGRQVICPRLPNRNHVDGIDDVLSLIQYHTDLSDMREFDNSNTVLDIRKFDTFYKKVIDMELEYSFDIKKYNTFYDWCQHEL